jgi:hypothetical protein
MNCANHPDRERTAFCQNCGKPLCKECTRTVGSAVFCEPCLAARLAGVPPGAPADATYGVNQVVDGVVPPPVPGAPSVGLATLLGVIPGVGAMYNGQYAKGIVHLIVFAILVSLANDVNGIFGLFIAGWVIYQIIDANHTARARLAGTPLPNPFGLNDIGERLGFGKSWPAAAPYNPAATPQSSAGAPFGDTTAPPSGSYTPPPYAPPASNWGAPPEGYNYVVPPGSSGPPPYGAPYPPDDPNAFVAPPRNRFPAGALWLIGLGVFFLIGNSSLFRHFSFHLFTPFLLIGLGVWLFIRKMTDSGLGLANDGTPMYRVRLMRALTGSIWVILVGVIFLLASLNILSWGKSWPLYIIAAGLVAIFRRSAYSAAAYSGYPYPPPPPTPNPTRPPATSTAILPVTLTEPGSHDSDTHDHDREGS